MQHKESLYPKDWFDTAQKDYKRAEILFNSDDYDGAGFHLQQALEKYFKGYLLSKGWKLKRIHDLEALLNAALAFDKALECFRPICIQVTSYYLEERYPFLLSLGTNKKDLESAMRDAAELIKALEA